MARAKRAKRTARPAAVRSGRVAEVPRFAYGARRLLLDTHTWIWWQTSDRKLGPASRAAIATATDVYLSVASAWEIAIKESTGKLRVPLDPPLLEQLGRNGFHELPIIVAHTDAVRGLPRHHRDPFDRLLIAQAEVEGLTIVTTDAQFKRYGVPVIDATT